MNPKVLKLRFTKYLLKEIILQQRRKHHFKQQCVQCSNYLYMYKMLRNVFSNVHLGIVFT